MSNSAPVHGNSICASIARFIDHKRALGLKYEYESRELRLLDRFLTKQGMRGLDEVTPHVIDSFLDSRPRPQPRSYNGLLGAVGRFFAWLVAQGELTQTPVRTRKRPRSASRQPFLFSVEQVRQVLDCAARLPDNPRAPLRGATYHLIFAILYGLGLRVGEASRLHCADFDRERSLLYIRETKFGKSRLLPLGPRLTEAMDSFRALRGQRCPDLKPGDPVFSFTRRGPIHPGTISQTFRKLLIDLDWAVPEGTAFPSAHHLRHSFAVERLLRWYREGEDPQRRLLQLATFLGHVDPTSTQVYLHMTQELLCQANLRFERHAAGVLREVQP